MGSRPATTPPPATQILDTEGVAAEVLFPDADVLGTGRSPSSPFGTGLAAGSQSDPADAIAGSRAHNRWLADFVTRGAARGASASLSSRRSSPTWTSCWSSCARPRSLGHRGILIPTRWFDRPAYHEPHYEPLFDARRGAGARAAHPLGRRARPTTAWATACSRSTPARPVVGGPTAARADLGGRLRATTRRCKYSMAENGAWWVPDLIRKMDEKWVGGHNTRKFGDAFRQTLPHEAERLPRSQLLLRGVHAGRRRHGAAPPHRCRQHDVGQRPPASRGHATPTRGTGSGSASTTWPRTRRDASSASTAANVYSVDVDALQARVDKIGPTVDEVHGDAAVGPVPAGV